MQGQSKINESAEMQMCCFELFTGVTTYMLFHLLYYDWFELTNQISQNEVYLSSEQGQ